MKFRKVVSVDNSGLVEEIEDKLKRLSDELIFYRDFPKDKQEIISRIGDADGLLVSWQTPIDREIIEKCTNLKYIGMCCSLYDEASSNVDIKQAREQGITVLGVKDYGDEGLVEFIISELIKLLHGSGKHKWSEEALELTKQKLGIIGLGTTGKLLAERAKAFGMDIYYYSRTRNFSIEQEQNITYLELEELLAKVDIISTHLPRNTVVLDEKHFKLFVNNKILINTSLGPTFNIQAFLHWIKSNNNYAIFDRAGMGDYYEQFRQHQRIIYSDKVSGWTSQARERLSNKVLINIEQYLNS